MDYLVTVCNNAAGEACPLWLGTPIKFHWSLPDPASFKGSEIEVLAVFKNVYVMIEKGVQIIVNVKQHQLDKIVLEKKLNDIVKTHCNF